MNWRYRFTLGTLVILFCFVIVRLLYWQVVKAAELTTLGKSQYGALITVSPKRGEILANDGFPLVANKVSYLVFANPKEIENKDEISKILGNDLQVDPASISAQLSLNRFWVPLYYNADFSIKAKIDQEKVNGIGYEEQYSRFYPEASMAAQLIGFLGKDELGQDKGYFGLEGYYDRLLKGKAGQSVEIHDAFGRPILAQATTQTGVQNGQTIKLSIDRAIQYDVESKLKDGVEKYGAKQGMAIIMDPKTGSILAMAVYPKFDPQTFWQYPPQTYINPIISDFYEPGSTFKSIVMASAIDAGVVTPDTKCDICSGPVSLGGFDIRTWDNNYFPNTSMTDVIIHSDNTGMVFVSKKMGLNRLYSYLNAFGIGHQTDIDLQGEAVPELRSVDQWRSIDVATASFGQGIDVTPIELLEAFSALANGGKRMQPHVVSQIQSDDGEVVTIPPREINQPISAETAQVITEILVDAVNKGEAQFARLHGYRIAGKTGTAQIPISGHYDPSKTVASFIGFAPADNPKFSMLVIYDEPSSSIYGSETAAPTFFTIAKDLLNYYNIPPSVPNDP